MNVLVTGADEVWGYLTAERILQAETLTNSKGERETVDSLVLIIHEKPYLSEITEDSRVKTVVGDISDKESVTPIILDNNIDSIFHFETVTRDRGNGENDFDGMIQVNVFGSLNILEACRASGRNPKLVFCSSCSVFQDGIRTAVCAETRRMPSSTYGTTKAIVELLVANYTKRGFVDGRNSILPMCVSWKPIGANGDFMHEVYHTPFDGKDVEVIIKPDTELFFNGYYTCIENLIETHEIPSEELGEDRSVLQPGITVSLNEMMDMFQKIGKERGITVGRIVEKFIPEKQEEFDAYNKKTDFSRAKQFGFSNENLEMIVRRYLNAYLKMNL